MKNEKLVSLEKYAQNLRDRLSSPVPPKHDKTDTSRAAFREFLRTDLEKTETKITYLKGV